MRLYFALLGSLVLTACGQSTPPSLEKTDSKAIAEFNKKYKSNEYVKFAIIKKERVEIFPSSSDNSIYNVKYRIAFQQDFDIYKNLMDRVNENEKILDPSGLYKNLTNLDRNSVDDSMRVFSDILNTISSEKAREINIGVESDKKFLKENEDLANKLYTDCKPCVSYIVESEDDKDYQNLKKRALYKAIASIIKDETYKIQPSGVGEEVIFFQIDK